MRNRKGPHGKYGYRGLFSYFSVQIHTVFCPPGTVTRAGQLFYPETLFTAICAALTEWMILPSSVPAQEERPFQPPFLASAHLSSRSGAPRLGASTFGCLAHSWRAVSNLSRTEGRSKFLGSAATAKARVPLPMIRKRRSSEWWWTPYPRASICFWLKAVTQKFPLGVCAWPPVSNLSGR